MTSYCIAAKVNFFTGAPCVGTPAAQMDFLNSNGREGYGLGPLEYELVVLTQKKTPLKPEFINNTGPQE